MSIQREVNVHSEGRAQEVEAAVLPSVAHEGESGVAASDTAVGNCGQQQPGGRR